MKKKTVRDFWCEALLMCSGFLMRNKSIQLNVRNIMIIQKKSFANWFIKDIILYISCDESLKHLFSPRWWSTLNSNIYSLLSCQLNNAIAGVNFINILQAPFCYESALCSFSLITVWLCDFKKRILAQKLLVKC